MASDPMITRAFVGVDSGGTRTNVSIKMFDADGGVKDDSYEVGESLSGALPLELLPTTLRAILAPLHVACGEYKLEKVPVHVWISAAGFTPWARDDYLVAMEDLLPTLLDGAIQGGGAANDGVSLLLGSRADGIIVAGTGSTVILRSPEGQLHQAGGHEWVACDDGSGFWIGIKAIRKAYRDFEAGLDSVLLQRLRQSYGLRSGDDRRLIEKFRDLAITTKDMKKEIARFAANVCAAAERGDKESQNIVKGEAEGLADVTAEALRRTFSSEELSSDLQVVQCGSVLDNEFYRLSFETQLEMRLRSDDQHKAHFEWQRVTTGGDAAVQLAQDLAESPEGLHKLDRAFRPAIFLAS